MPCNLCCSALAWAPSVRTPWADSHISSGVTICHPHGWHRAVYQQRVWRGLTDPHHWDVSERHPEWINAVKWSLTAARWSKVKGLKTGEQWSRQRSSLQGFTSCPVPRGLTEYQRSYPGWSKSTSGTQSGVMTCRVNKSHIPSWWWGEEESKGGSTIEGQAPFWHVAPTDSGCNRYQRWIIVAGLKDDGKHWSQPQENRLTAPHKSPKQFDAKRGSSTEQYRGISITK